MSAEGTELAPKSPIGGVRTEQPATDLAALKKMFDEFRFMAMTERTESGIDRDYYDGHQLTSAEINVLRTRGQPQLVINRVRRGVDGVLGIAEQGRTDPRAYMRNPPDPGQGGPPAGVAGPQPGQQPGQPAPQPDIDAADVASMTLRFIADTNHFQPLKMDVLENGLVEGSGAAIIECIGEDVLVTEIRWEEFFYDPRSRRSDFADARYKGIAKWMYADQLAAIYPKVANAINSYGAGNISEGIGAFDQTWEDRPGNITPWVDSKQRRVMAVDIHYLEGGKWWKAVFYAGGILEQAVSPYKDDNGAPMCPIEAWSAYVDRKNRRYGIVRDMRGPQDEINMRRSKLLHLVNVRQIQPIDANTPPVDVTIAKAEAAKPDGVIPPGWKLVDNTGMAQGQSELLAEAKTEIERMGPNPAILGRQGADASGRSVQLRQQAGLTELARVMGRFSDWELRCYKQMWSRARQFYTAPKWIRVTNDEGAAQYVRINDPQGMELSDQPHPTTGGPMLVPKKPKNHIAEMDVDIIVDTVPDTANLQQEIFQELAQLAQAYGPAAVPFQVLIQMSPLPRKRELLDMLEKAQAQAAQANAPEIQLKQSAAQAEIDQTKSNTARNLALAGQAEVMTVAAAIPAHVEANAAAQLPPGYTLDGNGQHVPLPAPPPPGAIPGASGPQPAN